VPARNKRHLSEMPEAVSHGIVFHRVRTMDEVLRHGLQWLPTSKILATPGSPRARFGVAA